MQARWLTPRDYVEAAELAEYSLAEIQFLLMRPFSAGLGIWDGEFLQGICLYQYCGDHLSVTLLSVHQDARRRGYGRKLLGYLCSFMRQCEWIERIEVSVPEEGLEAQIFLRSCRFLARGIESGRYVFEFWKTSLADSTVRQV